MCFTCKTGARVLTDLLNFPITSQLVFPNYDLPRRKILFIHLRAISKIKSLILTFICSAARNLNYCISAIFARAQIQPLGRVIKDTDI